MLPCTTVTIQQLAPNRGAYYYLYVSQEEVATWPKKRQTRLLCQLDEKVEYGCGLNHLGDGNFFIILSKARLKKLQKTIGDPVKMLLKADPNPLGVKEPEVLEVLLVQDELAKAAYEQLTDGKKRSLIYQLLKIKDIDKQVNTILEFLRQEAQKKRS